MKFLGPYRVGRELGRGGSSVVYLAEDTRLARRVALKIFAGELGGNGWLRGKIQREIELASRLADPGLCAIHDAGEVDGQAYIAMRYVEGESLAQWSERAPPLDEVLVLIERVARTLHRAHEAGVIHGDLKPSNLRVAPDGTAVILDFGSAHDARGASDGGFQGTPAYAAPEQIQPAFGKPDRRSDVFALGVILYECLTGHRPFAGSNPESLFRAVLSLTPTSPRRLNRAVTSELEAVVATALAKEQDLRYQTASDLAEDLRRVREHEPISVRKAGLWRRYRRWTERRPAVALGLATLLALLVAGLGLSGWFLFRDRATLANVRHLADEHALAELAQRAREDPWPRLARGVDAMDAWLAEAEELRARLASRAPEEAELRREFEALPATIATVRERREEAAGLAARTLEAHRAAWERVIAEIADVHANPSYGGLRVVPQEGLVPLGRDPHSRLFEFAHLPSGAVPEREPETGRLRVDTASALVFVLLPGGTFHMGAVRPGPGLPPESPNVDPQAEPDEGKVHAIQLDPFLLSKYLASRAQWARLGGGAPPEPNWIPFRYTREDGARIEGDPDSVHMGAISWRDATSALARHALTLPTEAQMEYAIRAGTSTVWPNGNDPAAFRASVRFEGESPVFEGQPNPFGLVRILTIGQLAQDEFGSYELPVRPGDGLLLVHGGELHTGRGGNWRSIPSMRSAARETLEFGAVRPARLLDQ